MSMEPEMTPETSAHDRGMIRREPVTDLLAVDGESLVLVDDKVLRLGPVATVVLQLLEDGPRSQAQLTEALEDEFGAPPEGDLTGAVEAQLNGLAAAGLITRDDEPACNSDPQRVVHAGSSGSSASNSATSESMYSPR
ncbi:PqqD family protein [Tessaracoccus sp. G1721]